MVNCGCPITNVATSPCFGERNQLKSSNTTLKQEIQTHIAMWNPHFFEAFILNLPHSIAPLAWCAQAWNELLILLQFWGSTAAKEQLLKLVHPFFFVTLASLGPIALRTSNFFINHDTMLLAMISTALTRLDVWCFRGDGMLTCQAQNAALTSQICWRTRPATDFQTLCTCVYKTKNLNLNTSKTWGFLGNIMIIIVIRYSTYRGIPTLWIWFFSQLSPKSAVPNSPRSEPHELGSKVCPTWLIEGKTPGWVLVSVFSIKTLREMDLKIRHLWSCFSGFLVE